MAVYTNKIEITDILIVNIKRDPLEFATWIETYLLRADAWYIERCENLGIQEANIITYAGGQKYSVIALLRNWVYIETLNELKTNGLIDSDDYYSKIGGDEGYKAKFESLNNSLTREMVLGLPPATINKQSMTGRKITLDRDLNPENYE